MEGAPSNTPESTHIQEKKDSPSRRTFLKATALAGASIVVGSLIEKRQTENSQHQDDLNIKNEKRMGPPKIPEDENDNKSKNIVHHNQEAKHSYSETALEQALMLAAKTAASAAFTKLNIPHGNKLIEQEKMVSWLKDNPVDTLFWGAGLQPVIEESLFRFLPSTFAGKEGIRWDVGIPTSVFFAMAHNYTKDDEESKKVLSFESIPITQFMGGLFYWYLMREKGYSHSLLAHTINNALPLSIGVILYRMYPEEKATSLMKKMMLFGPDKK